MLVVLGDTKSLGIEDIEYLVFMYIFWTFDLLYHRMERYLRYWFTVLMSWRSQCVHVFFYRVFGWGLSELGWIQPSFWGRSQPIQCLVALLLLGMEPTHFSVWLKDWGQSGSIQCLDEGIQCLVGANPVGAAPSARFWGTGPTRIWEEYSTLEPTQPSHPPTKQPREWVRSDPARSALQPNTR